MNLELNQATNFQGLTDKISKVEEDNKRDIVILREAVEGNRDALYAKLTNTQSALDRLVQSYEVQMNEVEQKIKSSRQEIGELRIQVEESVLANEKECKRIDEGLKGLIRDESEQRLKKEKEIDGMFTSVKEEMDGFSKETVEKLQEITAGMSAQQSQNNGRFKD